MIDLTVRALVVLGGVEHVLVQRLAVDRQALRARLRDRPDAGRGTDVHHVERGAGHVFREPQDAAEAQVLGKRVVRFRQMLEANPALADQLVVHVHDDVVVLGVNDAEAALAGEHLEGLPDVTEIDHPPGPAGQYVGREDLEGRVAGLDGFGELAGEGVRRLAMEHDVVGPVAVAAPDEILVPRLDGFERGLVVAPVGEIDQRGGAAVERGPADLVGARGDHHGAVGLHPGMMHVDVRVDAARHDDHFARVDDAPGCVVGQGAGSRHGGDGLALDGDVERSGCLRRDDRAALDHEIEHAVPRASRSADVNSGDSLHQASPARNSDSDNAGWAGTYRPRRAEPPDQQGEGLGAGPRLKA